MKGYYKNPEGTREVMTDGWFHTGDIGDLDQDGFLRITDRKKDIIVTSGGKNISPQNIENMVLADRLFSQIIVIGDKRHYLVALIVPNRNEVERFGRESGLDTLGWKELLKHPRVEEWVHTKLSERTKDLAPYEQIKYFALLENEMTQESGDLTPTLKIRRKIVMEKYKQIVEELYRRGDTSKFTPAGSKTH